MSEPTNNPLLSRVVMPGQRFTLPSGGLFYTNGELDPGVINAEIQVHPMTMIDDLVMKTPDKLLNGDGIVEVFSRCIPEILKPWDMLQKDMDFLVICLRLVTYGNQIEIGYTHSSCTHIVKDKEGNDVRHERQYKVDVSQIMKDTIRVDPTTIDSVYTVTLENGQVCKLRPMRYRAFIDIMQTQIGDLAELPPAKSLEKMMNMLVDIIISVDGIDDRDMILEWLNASPPVLVAELNDRMTQTFDWGTNPSTKVPCQDCGELMELAIPLDPLSFFS